MLSLNLMQRELCYSRIKLLTYMDRLHVYEKIINGKYFDADKFKLMRSQPILDVAIDYARVSSCKNC